MPSNEILSESITRMTDKESAEAREYLDKLKAWRAGNPAVAQMVDQAHQAIHELETLLMQGYVVVEEH